MKDERKYSRVYHSIIADDPKFAAVYSDDRLLAAWLRLLLLADSTWPSPAPIPRGLRAGVFDKLVEFEILDAVGRDHYRLHGLDKERQTRKALAQKGASARWEQSDSEGSADAMQTHSERTATAFGDGMPSQAKPSKAKPSQAEQAPGAPDLTSDPALDAYQRFYTYPTKNGLAFLDDLVETWGQERVARAIGYAGGQGRENLLSRTRSVLVLWDRENERRSKEARPKPQPFVARVPDNLSEEEIERLAAEYRAAHGKDEAA